MATMPPQSQHWPGTRAVLFVHGVGDAKPGDYAPLLQQMQAILGKKGTQPVRRVAGVVRRSRPNAGATDRHRDQRELQSVQLARRWTRGGRHPRQATLGRSADLVRECCKVVSAMWLPVGRRVDEARPPAFSVGFVQAESVPCGARAHRVGWRASRVGCCGRERGSVIAARGLSVLLLVEVCAEVSWYKHFATNKA